MAHSIVALCIDKKQPEIYNTPGFRVGNDKWGGSSQREGKSAVVYLVTLNGALNVVISFVVD